MRQSIFHFLLVHVDNLKIGLMYEYFTDKCKLSSYFPLWHNINRRLRDHKRVITEVGSKSTLYLE